MSCSGLLRDSVQFCSSLVDLVVCVGGHGRGAHRLALAGERLVGLVITAVIVEARSQSEVSRAYGVPQPWISRLVARYLAEGEAAYEPRPRRPHTSPSRLSLSTIDLIIELREKGLDNGPHTIAWHLQHHHQLTVSPATISRHLSRAG